MDLSLLADPFLLTEIMVQGLVRGSMYALMAAGLALIFGILGVKNFAHGEFFMLGAYMMFLVVVVLQLPFLLGLAAAMTALFLFGVFVERTLVATLRRRAGRDWLLDAFVLTIGLMVILQNLALILFGSRRRGVPELIPGSVEIGDIIVTWERLVILLVSAATGVALWAFIKHSRPGKAIRASAQNPEAAQTLGIDVARVYTLTFGLGSALAGLAGALLLSIFAAYPTVGFQPVLKSLAVVILGGLGHVPGAILGGLLLGVLEAYSIFFMAAGWQTVVVAGVVVLILIFRPRGLFASGRGDRP
jgi:branched-chain amino acid transport system permease protein